MKSSSLPSVWTAAILINGLARTIHADDSTAVTGQLGNAQRITNNPLGAVFLAELPSTQGILGSLVATSASALGTEFTVNFANLPAEGGPFCK
jgi:nicotinamide mononucleotide (NMN) deamidase PncC